MNDNAFMNGEIEPRVYDAEVVEEPKRGVYVYPKLNRVAMWWRRSRLVPLSLKSRHQARQAARDLVAAVLRSPLRFLTAVVRGLVAGARWWRRWVAVRDYREAAELSEKLADKFVEIRALTLFRWKVTGAVLVASALASSIAALIYGPLVWWTVGTLGSVALAILGRRRDGSPGRKAVLAGPRTLTWTMDPQVLVDAFRDAKLVGKDETLRLVERATRIGEGWEVTVDLPATRKAADVIKNRDALASALAVDEVQLSVERVRGNGGHAGRVAMWVADQDPYAAPPIRTPLLDVPRWDAWRPVPFGRDARDRRVDLPLVWTSLLVGAIPRQGKTFAARLAAAGLILDPHTRLYVADFKAGKDWEAASDVAHRFMAGDEAEHVVELTRWLAELVTEVQARYRRMRELDDVTCPESKVTPAMSRDRALDMPVTAIIIDEVQVPLQDRTPVPVGGRTVPAGDHVGELLTWLAKKGPAAGIVLVLATQRPDSQTIPSGLRAVLGSRFALRVMDWRDSNIVLGEQMNTRGYDSSRLLASHKGVGILRPDGGQNVVRHYLRQFRASPCACLPPRKPPSVRRVVGWIMSDPQNMEETDRQRLDAILAASMRLTALAGHVRGFAAIMCERRGQELETWMAAVDTDDQPALHSFVRGLRSDQDAVTAGLTLPWSSGVVEGHVNRVKMLKRQMFGRAKPDLLRKRVLHAG